ncbi:MAG TPA: hypothetical protein VLT47_06045 [Anaeromyxobacteraceae bacterium]|nr:hypothetical protein [Anaeromyxobacteraceae bacterium]
MARDGRTLRALVTVAVVGAIVTLAVLAWLVGAGRGAGDEPIVEGVPRPDREAQIDQAERATRARREAARKELERLAPSR